MTRSASDANVQLWHDRLQQFTKSKLTVQQFCRRIGCSVATYYHWKQKLKALAADNAATDHSLSQDFIPITVAGRSCEVVVSLPNGTQISLPAAATDALGVILAHAQRGASC
jgi:hypothetical protein